MSRSEKPQVDASVIAAVHRTGKAWRAVIGRVNSRKPAIVDSETFLASDNARLERWLSKYGVSRVISVLPASSVICRTIPLPNAAPDQLEPALRLQAEAHLLGIAPPHRLAMAVLHSAEGETTRSGLVLAWPENAAVGAPPTDREITYAPDVAALAALLNGSRPAEPLMWLDRSDGSVALALPHANGAVFRGTRQDGQSTDHWRQGIGRVLAETALSIGSTGQFIDSLMHSVDSRLSDMGPDTATLIIPRELVPSLSWRIEAPDRDETWWSAYGVAAGALLATTDQLAPLTQLREAPPREAPSAIRQAAVRLSVWPNAVKVLAACALLVAVSPLALSRLRLMALERRLPDIAAHERALEQAQAQLSMYRELGQQAWPMTKLLSDIACAMPLGIELDRIRIVQGETFQVNGRVVPRDGRTAQDMLGEMQANLYDSGMFKDVGFKLGDAANFGDSHEFDLQAKIERPYIVRTKLPEKQDFGLKTLRELMYGPRPADAPLDDPAHVVEATATAPVEDASAAASEDEPPPDAAVSGALDQLAETGEPVEPDSSEDEGDEARPSRRPARDLASGSRSIGSATNSITERGSASGLPPSQDIPPAVSDEQIAAMTLPEAKDALTRVARARRMGAGLDEATRERLKREFESLMARVREGR